MIVNPKGQKLSTISLLSLLSLVAVTVVINLAFFIFSLSSIFSLCSLTFIIITLRSFPCSTIRGILKNSEFPKEFHFCKQSWRWKFFWIYCIWTELTINICKEEYSFSSLSKWLLYFRILLNFEIHISSDALLESLFLQWYLD